MAAGTDRQMTLTMFMTAFGYHQDAWRHPSSRSDEIGGLPLIRDMAQAAERAKLDAIFIADSLSAQPFERASCRGVSVYEPVVTLAALIGSTASIMRASTSASRGRSRFPARPSSAPSSSRQGSPPPASSSAPPWAI